MANSSGTVLFVCQQYALCDSVGGVCVANSISTAAMSGLIVAGGCRGFTLACG